MRIKPTENLSSSTLGVQLQTRKLMFSGLELGFRLPRWKILNHLRRGDDDCSAPPPGPPSSSTRVPTSAAENFESPRQGGDDCSTPLPGTPSSSTTRLLQSFSHSDSGVLVRLSLSSLSLSLRRQARSEDTIYGECTMDENIIIAKVIVKVGLLIQMQKSKSNY
uniref:Uncharacterized protein n=1 Tax=Solanum lycopersicum TaxID=4081 RepID=A0A3Q7J7C1_SOLLC